MSKRFNRPRRLIGVFMGFLLTLTFSACLGTAFEQEVKDPAWDATPNAFFENLAKTARRGLYPRGFSGEQSYWTVVGVDGGGANSALISEDGAVELSRGGFSVEPFLMTDGRLLTWADVDITQSLDEGYLPMPGVTWKRPDLALHVEVFAAGSCTNSRLLVRYTVENPTGGTRKVTLALTARPFQVSPPTQSLNTPGGISPIHALAWKGNGLEVNGMPRVFPRQSRMRLSRAASAPATWSRGLRPGTIRAYHRWLTTSDTHRAPCCST